MKHSNARTYRAWCRLFRKEEATDRAVRNFNRMLHDAYTAASSTSEPVHA